MVEPFVRAFPKTQVIARRRLRAFPEKYRSLELIGNLRSRETQPSLWHVDKADEPIDDHPGFLSRPQVLPLLRDADHQRAMHAAGVQKSFAAWQHATVVRVVDNDRVVVEPVLLQSRDRVSDLAIHVLHGVRILRVVLADHRQVGVIREQRHVFGTVASVLDIAMCPAFVTVPDVDDRKKRLTFAARLPAEALAAGPVPAILVVASPDVEVRFALVRRVIPSLLQQVGIVRDAIMGNAVSAPHGLRPVRDRIHPGDPARPRRRTHRRVVKAVRVTKSFPSQLINRWRLYIGPAITTDPRDTVILAGNPEDVRPCCFQYRVQSHQHAKRQQESVSSHSLSLSIVGHCDSIREKPVSPCVIEDRVRHVSDLRGSRHDRLPVSESTQFDRSGSHSCGTDERAGKGPSSRERME